MDASAVPTAAVAYMKRRRETRRDGTAPEAPVRGDVVVVRSDSVFVEDPLDVVGLRALGERELQKDSGFFRLQVVAGDDLGFATTGRVLHASATGARRCDDDDALRLCSFDRIGLTRRTDCPRRCHR